MKLKYALFALCLGTMSAACTKTQVFDVYEVDPVSADPSGSTKVTEKSDIEFVSIVYSDLFESQITVDELTTLIGAYKSLGDRNIIIDRIIRAYLNDPGVVKPSNAAMRADVKQFIRNSFKRFLVREPDELELWYWNKEIVADTSMTVEQVYYVLLTTEEYKYY
jgi:hypothetical protein